MILNFKTRKEARDYCWKWSIPLKNITKGSGSHPWTVRTKETRFETGKDYKLVDVEGFTDNGKNIANSVQSKQIHQLLNGVVNIASRNGDRYTFNAPAGVAMNTLRAWEAKYFTEVAPAKAPAPKRAKKPKPVGKPSAAPVPAKPDLDSELDGGVNLAQTIEPVAKPAAPQPATVEAMPGNFVANRPYVLVDEAGFLRSHTANKRIVQHIKNNNGVLVFVTVDGDGDATISQDRSLPFVIHRERKFFRELGTGTVQADTPAVQTVDIAKQQRDKEIIEAAQAVEDALAEHQKAIEVVTQKARAVREAAAKLALLASK
ncbi:hypothetical protein RB16p251 [Escherichia phage RB16]|uniref:Conserved hypothetical phage protein n=1 Tax=Escherichia phage RB16 TaxID=2681599 RepID=D9ICW2_BPRB1|nr:hypothetical protein RB16p251 [Escherichia phage RB16]ADJ55555.1 conserved hypothetical phage protein [Escherichia phage RB16]